MPKRLTINDVRNRIEKYGYYIQDGENYVNRKTPMKVYDAVFNQYVNLSLNQMLYRISSRIRPEYDINDILPVDLNPEQPQRQREVFNPFDILPVDLNKEQPQRLNSFQRFMKMMEQYTDIKNASEEEKRKMFTEYTNMCKLLANGRKRNKTVKIMWNKKE